MKKLFSRRERPLAWAQLSRQKVRTGVAMGGIAFANVLIFMQLGFVNLFAGGATLLPRHLQGDLFISNAEAKLINSFSTFDRTRLYQAAAFDGIIFAEPLYLKYGTWAYDKESISYETRVCAYNPQFQIFDLPEVNQQQSKLREPFTALFDRLSRSQLGSIPAKMDTSPTIVSMINNQRIVVNGLFNLGSSFFLSEGNIITSDRTYAEMFGSNSLEQVTLGIIRVKPGTDLIALKQGIEKSVPGIKALTYKELQARELAFQDTNPSSTIFNFGAMMGFIVGVAIVYQVLYSDVSDHLSEYATLKAIGYSNRSLLLVIFQEAIFLAVLGYIPGFIATLGMYQLLTTLTKLELIMTVSLALNVFILTLAMCLISAAIASNKLRAADPADVF
ncbi:ABC transporter permease DevC [Chamaesiphon sp. GL140_3_metabinner_50]|uniref:ABC transporter permease DevC n=1 Tax=Chamaesiphon sp. GL140_3_metabinner_50 TaxID=2970812 RepID=UPI0025F414DC|nr:ABC transporter permease DevC [Chamaesiphon sp. GL140_3_metabinner_50]